MYNEFNTIESVVGKDKIVIYYGMAHTNVKANQIIVADKIKLDAQEALLDSYIKEAGIRFTYLKSNQSDKEFKNIQEAVVFLNAI